ncbi:MAG TPA: hypothetical protein PLC07_03325 [Bacillota bacterium]|nr:hypothetical protein [Bacillota bacterium]
MGKFYGNMDRVYLVLLIICVLVIVPFEISNEIGALPLTHDVPYYAPIRMINFFGDANVSGQAPTEAMYMASGLYPVDYQVMLLRTAVYVWQKAPKMTNIRPYSRQMYFTAAVLLLFFIYYQLARCSSEEDSWLNRTLGIEFLV